MKKYLLVFPAVMLTGWTGSFAANFFLEKKYMLRLMTRRMIHIVRLCDWML